MTKLKYIAKASDRDMELLVPDIYIIIIKGNKEISVTEVITEYMIDNITSI